MAEAPTQYASSLIQALRSATPASAVSPASMLNLLANQPNTQAAMLSVPTSLGRTSNIFNPTVLTYAPRSKSSGSQQTVAGGEGQGQIYVEPPESLNIVLPTKVTPVDLVDPVDTDPVLDPVEPYEPDIEDPVVPDDSTQPDDLTDPVIDDWVEPDMPDDGQDKTEPDNPVEPVDPTPEKPTEPEVDSVVPKVEPDVPVEPAVEPDEPPMDPVIYDWVEPIDDSVTPEDPVAPTVEPIAPAVEPAIEPSEPPIEPPIEPPVDDWIDPAVFDGGKDTDQPAAPSEPTSPSVDPSIEDFVQSDTDRSSAPDEQSPDTGLVDAVAVADAIGIAPEVAQQMGITEDTTVAVAPIQEPQYDPASDMLVVPEDSLPARDNYGGFDDLLMMGDLM